MRRSELRTSAAGRSTDPGLSSIEVADWRDRAAAMVAGLPPPPPDVARVLCAVPRHRFVPPEWVDRAYDDEPVPLPLGYATVSAPHMVALQLEFAELSPGLSILEIGAGYGYLAAALSRSVGPTGRVVAVEVDAGLAREATHRLSGVETQAPVDVVIADGWNGWTAGAPYDRIVVSCATRGVAPSWDEQLADDGVLVAPVGPESKQILTAFHGHGPHRRVTTGPACRFVALRRILPFDK